jgi:hypothetical protein
MVERHKLHSVRLDDEVWTAVKAMDCSLNQYLRTALLGGDALAPRLIDIAPIEIERRILREEQEILGASPFDPALVPGVSFGIDAACEEGRTVEQFACTCEHSGCQGAAFFSAVRFQSMCPACKKSGHAGDPRSCRACEDDSATGAI